MWQFRGNIAGQKTDRLDTELLKRAFLGWLRGERGHCSMARVPRLPKRKPQEYNFSPGGATYQREEQRFNLRQVTHLRLTIVPNKSGSGTATLTALRLFA